MTLQNFRFRFSPRAFVVLVGLFWVFWAGLAGCLGSLGSLGGLFGVLASTGVWLSGPFWLAILAG